MKNSLCNCKWYWNFYCCHDDFKTSSKETTLYCPLYFFNLSTLVPNAATILVGLNSSIVQIGFAVGAAIGGIVISIFSINAIIPIGIISVIVAIIIFSLLLKIEREKN